MAVHLGVATITRQEQFNLEKEESDRLARAAEGVAKHYNIEASEKALAWTNLIVVAFAIYTPRVVSIKLEWQMTANEAKAAREASDMAAVVGGQNVHPLRTGA